MPSVTGSFSGKITQQSALAPTDQPNHQLSLGEIRGTHRSSDPIWDQADLTYWGFTDIVDGNGKQHGYYTSVHGDKGRDWGTFEGQVNTTGGATTIEGTWKTAGGDGDYRGMTGGGKFKTVMKSETELECNWEGTYELVRAQTG